MKSLKILCRIYRPGILLLLSFLLSGTIFTEGQTILNTIPARISLSDSVKPARSEIFMTNGDDMQFPFHSLKKRFITGNATTISGDQLEKYPSSDLRNALTGLVPGLDVVERNGSPGLSAEEKTGTYGITEKIGVSARGFSMMYLIDGVPTDITEVPLDPQEIESVTVIKDIIGKTMFGPLGANGIISIKTRRGVLNKHNYIVNFEKGIKIIDRMPGWASGEEYAILNNQARINNGLTPLYSANDISAYAQNNAEDMYHPSIDFKDMMLTNTSSYTKASVSSSGGNDVVKYFNNLGYQGEGDIYKIGDAADYNRISTRSNIDIRINSFLKAEIGINALLTFRRSQNYGGYADSEDDDAMDLIEFNSAITDITGTPPNAFPLYARNDLTLATPWYAISDVYPINPVASLMSNGNYNEKGRSGSAYLTLEFDMSSIIKGLSFRSNINFGVLDLVRIGKAGDYAAYIATPSKTALGADTILLNKVHDGISTSDQSKMHDYYYQLFTAYENLGYERSFGNHKIQTDLTYSLYKISKDGDRESTRTATGVWTGIYTYNNKISIEGVLNYSGSYTYAEEKRYKLFPAIGSGWVISEENFMSNLEFIDYMKLHAQAGIIGNQQFTDEVYFRSDWTTNTSGSYFGPYSLLQWFGSNTDNTVYRTYPHKIGNPDLTWETRKEFNLGLDALMLNQKLYFEATYYNNLQEGMQIHLSNSFPYIAGISRYLPYKNFGKTRFFGLETGIQFTDNTGRFYYSVGGNATIQNSKIEEYDEPDYRYDYQTHVGKPVDAYFGQTCLGTFDSDAEALIIPSKYDFVLYAGDLKYQDLNGDEIIDDNDMSMVGHTIPRLIYAVNLRVGYKNLELTLIGTGRAFYDIPLTNGYFWNGWGDNNYSGFVQENIGGAYPRLTYYKVNNNFVASDFWLTKGGFFKIQNIELAYNLPEKVSQLIGGKLFRIYVRGANLLTFTKVKDVDPESINSGVTVYPLFKTFTGGIKLTF